MVAQGNLRLKCVVRWSFSWSPGNNWVTQSFFLIASGASTCAQPLCFQRRVLLLLEEHKQKAASTISHLDLADIIPLGSPCTLSQQPCCCQEFAKPTWKGLSPPTKEELMQPDRMLSTLVSTAVPPHVSAVPILQSLMSLLCCMCPNALTSPE